MPGIDDIAYVKPTYHVYKLGSIFKIVKFKCTAVYYDVYQKAAVAPEDDSERSKLAASLSRTRRMILEKALCNHWDWFCTFTLDKKKYDRYNLPKFQKDFTQFIRDERKRGQDIQYILIPEKHDDGAWHIHGLISGLTEVVSFKDWRKAGHYVKRSLCEKDYYNWPRYQKKFGFCSLGKLKCPVRSAFYVSKYVNKNPDRMVTESGSNIYLVSKGLNAGVLHNEVYGFEPELERHLTEEYEFCCVGYTKLADGLDWSFSLEFADMPLDMFSPLFDDLTPSRGFWEDMAALQYEQTTFD